MDFLLEFGVAVASAVVSFIVCYLAYGNSTVASWGYIAAFLPRLPVAFIALLGGANLGMFAWFSHTIGIMFYPMFLAIADILLLELAFLRVIKPFSFMLPKGIKAAIRAQGFIESMQKYHAIPRPFRVQSVYVAGIMAGMINLIFVIAFGLI